MFRQRGPPACKKWAHWFAGNIVEKNWLHEASFLAKNRREGKGFF